jgi:hypothetical protein
VFAWTAATEIARLQEEKEKKKKNYRIKTLDD